MLSAFSSNIVFPIPINLIDFTKPPRNESRLQKIFERNILFRIFCLHFGAKVYDNYYFDPEISECEFLHHRLLTTLKTIEL